VVRPGERSVSFDRAADDYDRTRGGLPRGERFADACEPWLAGHERVLEIGVGTGLVARPLTDRGHVVAGVDLAPAMLARARERIGARVVVADAARLPVATGAVDAVVAVWVLHVVADPASVVAEARRVLHPGGRLLVVPSAASHDPDDIAEAFAGWAEALGRTGDRPEAVRHLAGEAGLVEVAATRTPRHEYEASPLDAVAAIEGRTCSSLWDLDAHEWARLVKPYLDRLRSLPEPERPRRRFEAHDLLVFQRPEVGERS